MATADTQTPTPTHTDPPIRITAHTLDTFGPKLQAFVDGLDPPERALLSLLQAPSGPDHRAETTADGLAFGPNGEVIISPQVLARWVTMYGRLTTVSTP